MPDYPLPNKFLHAGDLCPSSFGRPTPETIDASSTPSGWAVCRGCGETINVRGRFLPEHQIPDRSSNGTT